MKKRKESKTRINPDQLRAVLGCLPMDTPLILGWDSEEGKVKEISFETDWTDYSSIKTMVEMLGCESAAISGHRDGVRFEVSLTW